MFGLGKKSPVSEELGAFDRSAQEIAQRLMTVGVDGAGTFSSAAQIANKARRESSSIPDAIDRVVHSHTRLVGMNGFVTNLGGFITMPVALPANVVGFYTVATRMVAAIALLSGHDVDDPAIRSAVLLDLIGTDATKVLSGVGALTGGAATNIATRKLPPTALAAVNKAVAFRIGGHLGQRALGRVPRAVPVAGGVIGAGLDVLLLRKIADAARRDFVVEHSN